MRKDLSSSFVRRQVGINVGKLRNARGFSQAELARRTSSDRSHINRLENGKNNVSLDILVKIANELDVPIPDFFAGLEGESPRRLAQDKSTGANQ